MYLPFLRRLAERVTATAAQSNHSPLEGLGVGIVRMCSTLMCHIFALHVFVALLQPNLEDIVLVCVTPTGSGTTTPGAQQALSNAVHALHGLSTLPRRHDGTMALPDLLQHPIPTNPVVRRWLAN